MQSPICFRTSLLFTFLLLLTSTSLLLGTEKPIERSIADQPNILWLSTEDIGPHVGCYGDPDATTPNIDAFAGKSLTYDIVWSNYPVCAPARTTIIGGMYASSNAAGNMRSEVIMPKGVEMFPHFLREKGYYCTNRSKEDYNYFPPKNMPWDESSKKAHYRNRKEGQPFFAVFNYTGTHESKIRNRPHENVIDPAKVTIPKYYPDIPEVREDWAQYLDNITVMDRWVKKHLDDLEKSGEADNTIVIFFGDHGGGLPRHKRYAGDSGLRVPFIVHVPEKLKELASVEYGPGKRTNHLVGFIDLAPTVLSIAGIEPPKYMQGHAFLGKHQSETPKYLYASRDRMDERLDLSRSIRDERFVYIRNYMPHLPHGQHIEYQQRSNSTSVWNRMFKEGKLNEVQSQFWSPRPPEELYDLVNDPEETVNLAGDPEFVEQLSRFRQEHQDSYHRFGDLGLIPEPIAYEFGKDKSRRLMLDDAEQFPLDEIFDIAQKATIDPSSNFDALVEATKSSNACIRYWGAMGLLVGVESESTKVEKAINNSLNLMNDKSDAVAIVALEVIANHGTDDQRLKAKERLCGLANLENSNVFASIAALNVIDRLDNLPTHLGKSLVEIPVKSKDVQRGSGYVLTLKDKILDNGSQKK